MTATAPHPVRNTKAILTAITALLPATVTFAQNDTSGHDFFESKIRPALVEHCYECHSQDAKKIKGGLLLDTRDASLHGGDSGAAVVPGKLNDSLLITAISYADSSLEMPPKYKLDDEVIADFRKWIEMGAPDPRESSDTEKITSSIDIEAGRNFWAYQLPEPSQAPDFPADAWPRSDIDRYLYAGLKQARLEPAPDADPATLLRRLYFDLIGLPPLPKQVDAFIKACEQDRPAAVAEVVDELLASPQFGERWGRHWLDVARYAESNGKDSNALYPEAWRYRDYVIDSFNADKPYDQFIIEQIAGDQMSSPDKHERAQQVIATGFLAIGPKSLNAMSSRQFRFDLVDEQIETLGKAILGTTVSCARCHDHKFDPIPQSDYYAMAGIFLSSDTWFGTSSAVQNRHASELIELPVSDDQHAFQPLSEYQLLEKEYQLIQARERIEEVRQEAREARQNGTDISAQAQRQILQLTNIIGALRTELGNYDEDGKPIALSMGVTDADNIFDAQILVRGEEEQPRDRVPRGVVQVLHPADEAPVIPEDSSGRLELAQWMASEQNPLTARVMANRVWHHLMGKGIVSSVDNFGATGQEPSHPELLDHLALSFVDDGWSVKSLIRDIVTSRSYQISSTFDSTAFTVDPENKLHWRADKRRLDAESLRDSILAISGTLDLDAPYGSIVSQASRNLLGGRFTDTSALELENRNRSVYLPIIRTRVPDALELFDFADPSLVMGARETTTVPSQALYLMNSEFILQQSEQMARSLIQNEAIPKGQKGIAAFYRVYSRPPTAEEMSKASAFYQRFVELAKEGTDNPNEAAFKALTNFCQSLFSSADFLYVI